MSTSPGEPWPVWEDNFINSYKWQDPKLRMSYSSATKDEFIDPGGSHREMPRDLSVSYWERPNYDDKSIEWSLSAEEAPLDLVVNNAHLMKCKAMTSIISSIQSLEELGRFNPFEPDYQGQVYFYNGGSNWKPWNHIYFMTRAGKGSSHVLKINKNGLYFVRLFYMGHWRRITVDDFLPYNENKELLLPCSKNRFNLWPQILTKAIFQVASLSWDTDLMDFSVVSCLTGWTHYAVDCRNLSIDAAWKVIQMYLVEDSERKEKLSPSQSPFCLNTSSQTCLKDQEPLFCHDCIAWRNIFASVAKTVSQLDRISPAEEHIISLLGAEVKYLNDVEELPSWKKFRWVDWARHHGGQRETLGIIKRKIKVYSPFRKFRKLDPYSEENIQKVADKVIARKITTGRLKDLLIAETETRIDSSDANLIEKNNSGEKLLEFDFSILYPFISVQVCRFWYSLPWHYYFSVRSCSPFEILNEEALQSRLTAYSETFLAVGEKMSKAFELLKQVNLNSSEHYRLLNAYKKSFFPPLFDSLAEKEKNNFIEDFNEVFDECLAEVIFEEHSNIFPAVACLEAQKVLFNNGEVFDRLVESLNNDEKSEFLLYQEYLQKQQKLNYSELILRELNSFKKERDIEGEVVFRSSGSLLSRISNMTQGSIQKKFVEPQAKVEDIDVLSNPKHNITLLRKILTRKKKYLSLYPFQNEHELKLQFSDYAGSQEIVPLQKWHLISRHVMNIHSTNFVPCHLKVKSSLGKLIVVLHDIYGSKLMSPSFNGTYYIMRNKVGYGILLYICPTEDMLRKPLTVKWSLRITGISKGDILHPCYRSPLLCRSPLGDNLEISSHLISGFYFPNSENIIGRFQIKTKSSPLVTMFVSIARSDLWIRVVIRGEDIEIYSVEGKGSLIIPVLLLDKNIAVNSTSIPDVSVFKGEIQLLDNWKLSSEELLFVQYLRSLPEKDILSLEDFDDCTSDVISARSDEADESELNFSEKFYAQFSKEQGIKAKVSKFNLLEASDSSDDCSILNKREFKSEPYGLLTHSPYWRVSLFIDELNKEDTDIVHDDQKLKEFEMFKISWEENDPGRAKKGEQLRNDFLKLGSKQFLKMQLDPDELSISDLSECGIEDDLLMKIQMEENEFFRKESKQKKKPSNSPSSGKSTESNLEENNVTSSFTSLGKEKLQTDGGLTKADSLNYSTVKPAIKVPVSEIETFTSDFELSSFQSDYSEKLNAEDYYTTNPFDELKLEGPETTNKQEFPDMPAISLLSDLLPLSKLEPVYSLYSTFCLKNRPLQSPETKSVTQKLLKKYAMHSECLKFNYVNPDEIYFQEPQTPGGKNMTFKELNELNKAGNPWEFYIQNIVEPTLYPITKRNVSVELLDLSGDLNSDNFFPNKSEEHLLNLKKEADNLIHGFQKLMVAKTKQGNHFSYFPANLGRPLIFSEKQVRNTEVGTRTKTGKS